VADTLDYLLAIHAIEPATAARYRATAMDIGAAAVQQGYDAVHGGVYESGLPGQVPNSTLKVWWVQMESMMALYKLYQHSGDEAYLQKLAQSTCFVRQHVLDGTYGEMFWQVGGVCRN
jgi:mannose/cellobiose epimerase-like protein (N-acyl-D-glucosamine 2-epimerase family)